MARTSMKPLKGDMFVQLTTEAGTVKLLLEREKLGEDERQFATDLHDTICKYLNARAERLTTLSPPGARTMTRDAGRELDAEIAEKVMGWRWFAFKIRGVVGDGVRGRYLAEQKMRETDFAGRPEDVVCDDALRDVPNYSGDIGAAWLVVEKMREHSEPRFRNFRMSALCYNRTYATFDARIEDDWCEANGEHATPLAICLAALSALSQEPDNG